MIHGLFGFSGRLRRLPFLGYILLTLALVGLLQGLVLLSRRPGGPGPGGPDLDLASDLLALLTAIMGWWIGIALPVKRLHDLDRSGWLLAWALAALALGGAATAAVRMALPDTPWFGLPVALVCLGNLAFNLWLAFAPGTPGPNRFDQPRTQAPGWRYPAQ